MKRSRSRRSTPLFAAAAIALSALALLPASPAAAQTTVDDGTKAAARTLAETGKRRFEAGDYPGAIEALRDAEKYYRAPTITRLRALAHEKLGQLLEARAALEQVAAAQLAPGASPEFVKAQAEAKTSLAALELRIPSVQITLLHAPARTRVTLDGKPLDAATLARPLRLNPGKYVVAVEPPGAPRITRPLDLQEHSSETVEVDLAPPPAKSAAGAASGAPSDPPAASAGAGRSFLGPAIALGVAGAGLVTGAIAGGLSFVVADDIRRDCGAALVCPPAARDRVEEGKTFGYVSTVGFAVAGAGAAVGVVLLVLRGKDGAPANVGVALGPSFTGVKGSF